jgi:hypothetical protein
LPQQKNIQAFEVVIYYVQFQVVGSARHENAY